MKFYDNKQFGDKIKEIRKARGFTRDQVVQLSGIGKRTLVYLENGETIPKIETLQLLSLVLKVDLFALFNEYRYVHSSRFRSTINEALIKVMSYDYEILINDFQKQIETSNETISQSAHLMYDELKKELAFLKIHSKFTDQFPLDEKSKLFYQETLSDAKFEFHEQSNFDYLDFRIVNILFNITRMADDFEGNIAYLELYEAELKKSFLNKEEKIELEFLLHSGYVFLYHRLDDYDKVIERCETAMQLCIKTNDWKYWYLFSFRMLVSKYKLGDSSYEDNAREIFMYLFSTRQYKLLENVIRITKNQYPNLFVNINRNCWMKEINEQLKK